MEEKIENELKENNDPVEEVPTEVQAQEQEPQKQEAEEAPKKNLVSVEKPDNNEEGFDKVIERERSVLFNEYKKSRKISNIITVGVLLVGLAGVICITQKNMALTIVGWSLMGATVLGLIIYYAINKNKFPNRTREYIKLITKMINENTFKNEQFTDVVTDPEEKFDVAEVIGDGVYADLGIAQSRNVVRGKFAGKDFLYGEVALFKPQQPKAKKEGPVFVGKYISYPNNLQMKGRIIVNIKKSESPLDLPTKIEDLTALHESANLAVYGLKETDYERVLGKKFFKEFTEDLALKDHLINVNLVVWAGKSAVYFSYDDGAMGLPFDKPFDKQPYDQMADNLTDAFELLNKIGK